MQRRKMNMSSIHCGRVNKHFQINHKMAVQIMCCMQALYRILIYCGKYEVRPEHGDQLLYQRLQIHGQRYLNQFHISSKKSQHISWLSRI